MRCQGRARGTYSGTGNSCIHVISKVQCLVGSKKIPHLATRFKWFELQIVIYCGDGLTAEELRANAQKKFGISVPRAFEVLFSSLAILESDTIHSWKFVTVSFKFTSSQKNTTAKYDWILHYRLDCSMQHAKFSINIVWSNINSYQVHASRLSFSVTSKS